MGVARELLHHVGSEGSSGGARNLHLGKAIIDMRGVYRTYWCVLYTLGVYDTHWVYYTLFLGKNVYDTRDVHDTHFFIYMLCVYRTQHKFIMKGCVSSYRVCIMHI
jgi:hypothetical protein